ncbi:MAG: hypothetical protein AAF799_39415 [Myxococcota bacterium]
MSPPPPPPPLPPLPLLLVGPPVLPPSAEDAQPVPEASATVEGSDKPEPQSPEAQSPSTGDTVPEAPATPTPPSADAAAEAPATPETPAPTTEASSPARTYEPDYDLPPKREKFLPEDEDEPRPSLLPLGTRNRFVTFSVGRSFVIGGDDELPFDSYLPLVSPPLRLEQSIGMYPMGRERSGFFISAVLQEAFMGIEGPKAPTREFGFAPRIGGDIPIAGDTALYLSPSFQLGYNLHTVFQTEYDYYGTTSQPTPERTHRMDVQMAMAAKILLANRMMLSFRPIDFQIVTDFETYSLRWNVVGGVGLTF